MQSYTFLYGDRGRIGPPKGERHMKTEQRAI